MRRWLCAAVLVAVALSAAPSRASFTTLLEPLRLQVVAESAKLDGHTDKPSRRKKRTLDAIDGDLSINHSDTVASDVELLRAAGKPLLKLFGDDYMPVADAVAAFTSRVRDDVAALAAREASVVDVKTKAKVDKLAAKASAALDAIVADRPFAQRIAKLLAAAEAIESGNKRIDADAKCPKANPPGGHHGVLRATIGDRDFSSKYQSTSMVHDKGTGALERFVLSGTREIGGQGDTVGIFIQNFKFHGAGVYVVDNVDIFVIYEFPKGVFYDIETGSTVDIASFDTNARDLRGTFTGTFLRGGSPSLAVEDGAFESCNWADSTEQ